MNDPSTSPELTKSSSGHVSDEDIELKAIKTVLTALSGLRGEARSRVVEYVFKRLGLMSEAVPISTSVNYYQLLTPADIARSTSTKDEEACIPQVSMGETAVGCVFHGLRRTHVDVVGSAHVGRSEKIEKTPAVPMVGAMGAVGEGERFRAVLVSQSRKFPADFVESLIPG